RLRKFEGLAIAACPAVAGVVERRIHAEPAVLGDRAEVAVRSGVVAGAAVADYAARKFGLPDDRLLHFGESGRVAVRRGARDPGRLFAGQVASELQGVDSDIHQRTAAGQVAFQTPHVWRAVEAEVGVDHFQ